MESPGTRTSCTGAFPVLRMVQIFPGNGKFIDGETELPQIADCAWFAYQMPQEVCVREIVIAKTKQAD